MTPPHALAPGVTLSAIDPVVLPGSNSLDMTNHVAGIALRSKAFTWWWIAVSLPATLTAVLVGTILYLFYAGVGIWGIDWPVAWGFAIINYVWWIAIASGGTFISALFYLTRAEWRSSINRIAESMTLFGAACAGIYPILHLGRPWFFYWLFPYPDSMDVWPQFRSPLLWDFFAILTYVISSALFWYLGLLPDLATLRDRAHTRMKQYVYGALALGFRGTGRQWNHYHTLYGVLAAIMAPLVCSVHSIVGLDFAGAATNGWHSTMYPPFFIFGAFLSGFATVLLLIIPMRRLLRLERYVTGRHLDVLGRLLLTSSLFVGFAYIMDLFNTYYGGEKAEIILYQQKVFGYYAGIFWATVLFNVLLPQLLWFRAVRLNQPVVALISIGVIVGMWCERFTIVVVALHRPRLPSSYGLYHATVWDWLTMMGTVGLFIFGILMVVRLIPVISMFEMREILRAAPVMRILLASFETEQGLTEALPRLRAAGLGAVETYTPKRLEDDPDQKPSILPLVVLIAGLLGFAGGFFMQSYANMVSYPVDIGGRPTFSWPAFVPIAFENGILAAIFAGFIGFLVVNRLPRLWDPVDEAMLIRRASRDLWCVAIRTEAPERTHALLRSLSADQIEEVAG